MNFTCRRVFIGNFIRFRFFGISCLFIQVSAARRYSNFCTLKFPFTTRGHKSCEIHQTQREREREHFAFAQFTQAIKISEWCCCLFLFVRCQNEYYNQVKRRWNEIIKVIVNRTLAHHQLESYAIRAEVAVWQFSFNSFFLFVGTSTPTVPAIFRLCCICYSSHRRLFQ